MSDIESELELEAELAELRRRYARELPKKLDRLGELLSAARESGDRTGVDAARQLAHSLKGSSGSYGFDQTSLELRRIEECLASLLEKATLDVEAHWPVLASAFANARAAI